VVVAVRKDLLESNALFETLKSLAGANELHIGICEAYPGFHHFPQRLKQAKRALNRAEAYGGVVRYGDVFEEELTGAQLDFPKELLCMRSVLAMSRYDRLHDTNYQETAEIYVKNRFNAVRTAGELFIHRSTFLYRLERIKAQFGLDLDDKDLSMLHLLFSLRIAREL
jgi:DNA-binding PucR family transcriptional regulator